MTARRITVPELDRKFGILRALGVVTTPKALADAFGVSPKTIRWWVRGTETRAPEQIPADKFGILIGLFAKLLPDAPPTVLQTMLLGPAVHLEDSIRMQSTASLRDIIDRDGVRDQATIIRRAHGVALVDTDEGETVPVARIAIGEWFRIEFRARHGCRYAIAFQNAGQNWGALLPAPSNEANLLVPGRRADGTPTYMRERHQRGAHRFVCFQSAEPFPAALLTYVRNRITVDQQGLAMLAAFYERLEHRQRACQIAMRSSRVVHDAERRFARSFSRIGWIGQP